VPAFDLRGLLACTTGLAALLAAAPPVADARTDPEDLVLRLGDLGAGYVVGDDGGCGSSFGREGTPPPLLRLERRHPFRGCGIEFDEAWAPPGVHRPADVVSHAYVFRDSAGAAAALRVGAGLLQFAVGPSRSSFVRRPPSRPVGDEAVVLETDEALARGRPGRPGVAVTWRTGRVLSFVFEAGLPAERGEASALALAERQQARLEAPTPLRPHENDDLEVPLDDPQIAGLVHWLGRGYDPPGRLGRLRLSEVYRNGPGWAAGLRYAGGVWLGAWRPRAFARFKRSRLGRLVWHSPCAKSTRFDSGEGRAVIYRGYGPPEGDRPPHLGPIRLAPGIESGPCPTRERDRVLAHVHLEGAVVTVNVPVCFFCIAHHGRGNPYNSLAGMKAVIRALRPRTGGLASDVLQDLAGLQATRADVLAPGGAPDVDADLLQVRVEAALGGHHRVAAAVPERGALLAHVADLRHGRSG
jgi:hypothetical protein